MGQVERSPQSPRPGNTLHYTGSWMKARNWNRKIILGYLNGLSFNHMNSWNRKSEAEEWSRRVGQRYVKGKGCYSPLVAGFEDWGRWLQARERHSIRKQSSTQFTASMKWESWSYSLKKLNVPTTRMNGKWSLRRGTEACQCFGFHSVRSMSALWLTELEDNTFAMC